MPLKLRLAAVVVVMMAAFIGAYSLLLLGEVRERAEAETEAALPWTYALLPEELPQGVGTTAGVERLAQRMRDLGRVRHVAITLRSATGEVLATAPAHVRTAPAWLEAKAMEPVVLTKTVWHDGEPVAQFELRPAVADELAELWEDYLRSVLLMLALSAPAVALIVGFTLHALRPLDRVRDALRTVERGEAPAPLPPMPVPEVDEIAAACNRMADALRDERAQRQTLMRALLEAEEQTRRSLAHDLHDELSPYLVALQPLTRLLQTQAVQGVAQPGLTATVDTIVDHQRHVMATLRRILEGLGPPELETLGLRRAIEGLARRPSPAGVAWPEVDLRLRGEWSGFWPTLDVSVYRMVQECLTNARRHAGASRVSVGIGIEGVADAVRLVIDVHNDGQLSASRPPQRRGLGTVGMAERCAALGGRCQGGPDGAGGWHVHIELPLNAALPARPSPVSQESTP